MPREAAKVHRPTPLIHSTIRITIPIHFSRHKNPNIRHTEAGVNQELLEGVRQCTLDWSDPYCPVHRCPKGMQAAICTVDNSLNYRPDRHPGNG
jgi:hypothetical protein